MCISFKTFLLSLYLKWQTHTSLDSHRPRMNMSRTKRREETNKYISFFLRYFQLSDGEVPPADKVGGNEVAQDMSRALVSEFWLL